MEYSAEVERSSASALAKQLAYFNPNQSIQYPILATGGHVSRAPHFPNRDRRIVSQALPETRKREGVPTTTVFPCPSGLKTGISEKRSNAPVCELVTILGANGFTL